MIEEKYVELINKEIDGFNSPEESSNLKNYLSKNPEAQAMHAELSSLTQMLELVDEKEPSVNLKKNILNAIKTDRLSAKSRVTPRQPAVGFFQSLVSLRYGLTFAAGLAAGLALFIMIEQPQVPDLSNISGAMMQKDAPAEFTTLSTYPINMTEIQGSIAVKASDDLLRLELFIASPLKLDALIGYEEGEIDFRGIAHLDGQSFGGTIGVEADQVLLSNMSANQYVVIFDRKAPRGIQGEQIMVNIQLAETERVLISEVFSTASP